MIENSKICYLCGQMLDYENEIISPDHVPPKQFYIKKFRKIKNPNLYTIDVHDNCNKSYQKDEDYFYHSIGPLAIDSNTGVLILEDLKSRFSKHKASKVLGEMVLDEFLQKPSNLILPDNIIGKIYDKDRVNRIIWKIVRGLYFKQYYTFLPQANKLFCKV